MLSVVTLVVGALITGVVIWVLDLTGTGINRSTDSLSTAGSGGGHRPSDPGRRVYRACATGEPVVASQMVGSVRSTMAA